jgi:glucose/arabinose dehydrogenase
MSPRTLVVAAGLSVCALSGLACAGASDRAITQTYGPDPQLPQPNTSLVPTINVVNAVRWREGQTPVAHNGASVSAFATGLDHPRWLYVLPNGDVLVAETNAPELPDANTGIRGWFMARYQKKAGGAVPSADRITLLRDSNGDGVVDTRTAFLTNLHSPFGMALVGDTLYVANTNALVKFPYSTGATSIEASPETVLELPAGTRNRHWTKNIIASPDGSKLYIAIGSDSDVAENGMAAEEGRAQIWEVDLATGSHRAFATGLRNPVGMAWEPLTGALWAAVNERDELGNDLVPDYMTAVQEGAFYGWPYSYYGQHLDPRVEPQRPDLVATAIVPDYALGAHTASLGLTPSAGHRLPAAYGDGMFVGQHGSWNRKPRSGYKVVFVPFINGRPNGLPLDVLTGFVQENGDAMGRPVGVAVDAHGGLLVADDVGNVVWRVTGGGA